MSSTSGKIEGRSLLWECSMTVCCITGSARHFSVLTSDNTWRLYCLDNLQIAEQTFELQLRSQQ